MDLPLKAGTTLAFWSGEDAQMSFRVTRDTTLSYEDSNDALALVLDAPGTFIRLAPDHLDLESWLEDA